MNHAVSTKRLQHRRIVTRLCLAGAILGSGCTVGPNYHKPDVSTGASFAGLDPSITSGAKSLPVTGDPQIIAWWDAFSDPQLTSLVQRAVIANLDLAQAQAVIRQARASRIIAASGWYPSVNASSSVTRSRAGNVSGASTSNLFREGFDASWEIDVFGGTRRGVEAADAVVLSAIENRRDVQVTLAAEVATNYFELRSAQRQLAIARSNLETQQQTLDLTKERFEAGFVSALDVANARAQVASTTATIPSFEALARSSMYALGVLLAQQPASLVDELSAEAPIPAAPDQVPVGLPSDLLERRPDIRRADADLHAATARIGVATADLFPKFAISGAMGLQGSRASSLGTLADRFWSIGPSVDWPLFQGGKVRANIELEKATVEQSLASYKLTVLTALQEVEVAMLNFAKEQQRRTALAESVEANRQAVDLSTQLYSAGKSDFLNVLTAQRSLFVAEDSLAQSDRDVSTDLVALYKALGGGWDPSEATPSSAESPKPVKPAEPIAN